MSELPTSPEDVRVRLPDGREIPCELQYVGLNEDGLHEWKAVSEVPFRPGIDRLLIGTLPPRTSIGFDVVQNRER